MKGSTVPKSTSRRKAKKARKVVLIDDEPFAMKYYIKALEWKDLEVDVIRSANKACQYFSQPREDVMSIILDIMMPPGRFGAKKTDEGMLTGVFLMSHIVGLQVDIRGKSVPIAVLTNAATPAVIAKLHEEAEALESHEQFRIWPKMDTSPFAFADQFF